MLSPRYPSSSSTCDSVEDNRFSTSAFCHEPFHPITLGQEVAGIDVGADIHQARKHAPAHTKGEVGAETRLDLAGEREGRVSVLRLHNFGVHERGALDGVD